MAKIKKIYSREIIDSRGLPSVETSVELSDGVYAVSSVPSGASKGTYEAADLRDNDKDRHNGMGVLRAVDNVLNVIAPKIIGMEAGQQQKIDSTMIALDGTQNKGSIGANAILSVSQAVIKASAKSSLIPLSLYIRQFVTNAPAMKIPTPMFALIEGGKHGGKTLNFQEFLLVPASSKSYPESLEMGVKAMHSLRSKLYERGETTLNAFEGGYSPNLQTNQAAIGVLKEGIEAAGYSYSLDAFIGLDVAASSFLDGKNYRILDRAIPYTQEDFTDYYKELMNEFSLIYIEDPFAEDDWEGWKKMYETLGTKTLIVGDNLIATNPYRLQLALDNKVVGGVVIKPSQIGTVTEAIAVAEIARYTGLKIIVSTRSGETMDAFIADFAVGIGADYVKFGAPGRERIAKYNKLLQIEKELESF